MDTLSELNQKLQLLTRDQQFPGVSAVIRHIEVAESYFQRARSDDDHDLFTDVIYRTNHAFEGILKESYTLLTGKSGQNKTPNQIEQSYASSEVFKPRVMELFTNYRQKWRNPSTHDHQLFFNQQEAFLSILAVTSFVSILMDQMIETLAFDSEAASVKKAAEAVSQLPSGLNFTDQVAELLLRFSTELAKHMDAERRMFEVEVQGRLHGFLATAAPDIDVVQEPNIADGLRPDFMLKSGGDTVILELRSARGKRDAQDSISQIIMYLQHSGVSNGVVFNFPHSPTQKMVRQNMAIGAVGGGPTYNVIAVRPEDIN